jgi:hypothetical protein
MDDNTESIIRLIRSLRSTMQENLPQVRSAIDDIICSKDTSVIRIERMLDTLLDHMHVGIGEEEFLRLNAYYGTVNEEYAMEYRRFYEDLKKDT